MMWKDMAIVVLVVLCIFTFALGWAYRNLTKEIDRCDFVSDSLDNENRVLQLEIDSLTLEIDTIEARLDSLKKRRNKVITEYVSKYEQIDSATADALLNEFKGILPKDSR